ncbi:MAG: amidohydrolase family protein [Phycisphaerales bacterium JB052]
MNDAPQDDARSEHAPYHTDAPISAWLSASQKQAKTNAHIRIDARAIADAHLGVIEHASLVLQASETGVTVRFAGVTDQLPERFKADSTPVMTLHDQFVLPALVNAHTHLDLTHIGPQPHQPGDGFVSWVDMIRTNRAAEDDEIMNCVRLGIEKSLAGGVIAVGDIAGAPAGRLSDAPARALAESPLNGVSYLEFFGFGSSAAGAIRRISAYLQSRAPIIHDQLDTTGVRLGLQPHATNTVDLAVYRWVTLAAQARGMPLCTHLAETPEEREFIAHATGPQRDMLERFGVWDDSALGYIGKGKHPIEHLRSALETQPYLVAHVNDADDAGIETLARTKTSVAYCPRASAYFDAPRHFGPHRYRDMLQAGINVCLGTDSIVNLDTHDRISTLDDMRALHQGGDHDARRLLSMGTTNGASALHLDPERYTIRAGSRPIGLISIPVDPEVSDGACWSNAMQSNTAPNWLYLE